MVNQRLAPSSIEARGVVARYESGREALTIWSSTQNPHILRTFVARMLDLGEDRVRAIAPEVGGGFGAKINIYGEEYVAAALSKRLGLPIKWIEDRSEAFLATVHGRDLIAYVELAATREGKVLGQDPDRRVSRRGAGPRRPTSSSGRWTCWPASSEMDPAELRRKNFIQPDQFPYRTRMGAVYDSGDYEKALDHALHVAGWERLGRERDAARADGRLVGLGLSMYVESCGLGPSSSLPPGGWEHAQVTVERDGRISATTGVSPHGQGNETTFAQMLADQFGVPLEHVTIHHGDTAVVK